MVAHFADTNTSIQPHSCKPAQLLQYTHIQRSALIPYSLAHIKVLSVLQQLHFPLSHSLQVFISFRTKADSFAAIRTFIGLGMEPLSIASGIVPIVQSALAVISWLSSAVRSTDSIEDRRQALAGSDVFRSHFIAASAILLAETSAFTAQNYESDLTIRLYEFCEQLQNAGPRMLSSGSAAPAAKPATFPCLQHAKQSADEVQKVCANHIYRNTGSPYFRCDRDWKTFQQR